MYGNLDAPGTSPNRNANQFYVTKFGCSTVEGVEKNMWLNPLPGMPKSFKKVKITAVMVTKDCGACTTECGATDGSPAEPWELRASNLVK